MNRENNGHIVIVPPSFIGHVEVGAPVLPVEVKALVPVVHLPIYPFFFMYALGGEIPKVLADH